MAPTTPPIFVRHFLLALPSILALFCVTPCLGDTSREISFTKLKMCSDTLKGTDSVSTRSNVHCAVLCATRSTCNGFSYLGDGTCNLHEADLAPVTCSPTAESTVHFLKETDVPSIQCQNGGKLIDGGLACRCFGGYVGNVCERLMTDCTEGLRSGHYPVMAGLFKVRPSSSTGPIQVRCNSGVHHTVLERWVGNVTFNVSWDSYVKGFGDAGADYWMGLENLHLITSNDFTYNLGIQVSNVSNDPFYQRYYMDFKVKGEDEKYSMTFASNFPAGAPASPLGDCLSPLKNLPFSAYDVDNDDNSSRNCAADFGGGWWYGAECSQCNLVGQLRWFSLTRVAGSVSEVFWLPGLDEDFSPAMVSMFLYRN